MLRLCITSDGDEYFELNRDEPGTALSSKNHTGGLEGTEDHLDGKIFAITNSPRCLVKIIKTYLSHLNPNTDRLFQRPKDLTAKFNPNQAIIWYQQKALGHNTLDNMLRNMSERAGILPYYTNHSLRATTVTILSSNNVETRKIKAVTGPQKRHKHRKLLRKTNFESIQTYVINAQSFCSCRRKHSNDLIFVRFFINRPYNSSCSTKPSTC